MTAYSFLSTYPSTRCGLATFTEALASAMVLEGTPNSRIVRMMDELARPALAGVGTRSVIVAELGSTAPASESDIRHAAHALSRADVAVIQHEYGIFGGEDGADVIRVMKHLTVPSIVVLHTVLDAPTDGQRAVLEAVAELADAIVVMTEAARMLLSGYAVDPSIVTVIPHGVTAWTPDSDHSNRPNRPNRTVLTWGLIGPGKGIEHGIRAFTQLGDDFADVRYVVSGQTHPKVLAHEGEAYRDSLIALVAELGLQDRVTIADEYLDAAQLAARVTSVDAVLLPYDSRNQVTSGVLVEAISVGKPVVATAFPHAIELLGAGTGIVVEHGNPTAIADGLRTVLDWPSRAESWNPASITTAPSMTWGDVALLYRELAGQLTAQRADLSA